MTVDNLIDLNKIEQEFVVFLRNSDIFSIETRGVATTTDSGTFSADSDYTIDKTNVKNIRSITVDAAPLIFGEDYIVDYNFLDSTIKCKISFTNAQTGDYEIEYDYGTDKIYPDFPRVDLTINSYPRMSFDITSIKTNPLGLGAASTLSDLLISVYLYVDGKTTLNTYLSALRQALLENQKNFYYIPFVTLQGNGPTINEPARADKILTKTTEIRGLFAVEDIS